MIHPIQRGPLFDRPRLATRPKFAASAESACGKVPHMTELHAVRHMESLIAGGLHDPGRGVLHYYWCPRCAAWHVGHDKRAYLAKGEAK